MNNTCLLIDKIPIPVIIHDQDKIIHSNEPFNKIISLRENKKIDFLKWLSSVIKNDKHVQTLLHHFHEKKTINLETEAFVNGVVRHWKIFSFPFLIDTPNECQITYLQDISANFGMKSYWDLHLRANKATMELLKEITQRKKMEARAARLSEELIVASREAGMAEVAASVLHNIGNILNSAGVSLTYLKETNDSNLFHKVSLTFDLLKKHQNNLLDYFNNDEKGKLIPEYLIVLFKAILKYHDVIKEEINNLVESFEYIRETVATQNEIARPVTIIQKVSIPSSIDSAINLIMSNNISNEKNIKLVKEYNYTSLINVDRNHLMQILINLLKNAKEAVYGLSENKIKIIIVKSNMSQQPGYIELQVCDNGIGIPSGNLKKIFMFGFSKKEKGHGFGLHNSALMAKEMGGSLMASSEGIGRGSQFTLTLPIDKNQPREIS